MDKEPVRESRGSVFRRILRLASSFALATILVASCSSDLPPDTQAGHTLEGLLDAFNTGSIDKLAAYQRRYQPDKALFGLAQIQADSGGFEKLHILKSEPFYIEFVVNERAGKLTRLGMLDVSKTAPHSITSLILREGGVQKGMVAVKLDNATRARVINAAIEKLKEHYVFSDLAVKMEGAVRQHWQQGDYDSLTDPERFVNIVSAHLREISHDKHLAIILAETEPPKGTVAEPASNCGFQSVKRLESNVGYLKLDKLGDPALCSETAIAAMERVAGVRAIIFDLRDNGGGHAGMVNLLGAYLFSEPQELSGLWEPKEAYTRHSWTLPYVPGSRFAQVPAYVLTSPRTFSAAEQFAYDLKNLKRAVIVGQRTGGGAHPTGPFQIDQDFTILIPWGRVINPITQTDWEQVGVQPDVEAPSAAALTKALELVGSATSPPRH